MSSFLEKTFSFYLLFVNSKKIIILLFVFRKQDFSHQIITKLGKRILHVWNQVYDFYFLREIGSDFFPWRIWKKFSLSLCSSWLEEVMHEGCIRKMGFILQMFCIIMVRKAWENASFPWRASLLCVEDKLAIYLLFKVYETNVGFPLNPFLIWIFLQNTVGWTIIQ